MSIRELDLRARFILLSNMTLELIEYVTSLLVFLDTSILWDFNLIQLS